jgi:hypothetical protein
MAPPDFDYVRRRIEQEKLAAEAALSPAAQGAHRKLLESYTEQLAELQSTAGNKTRSSRASARSQPRRLVSQPRE